MNPNLYIHHHNENLIGKSTKDIFLNDLNLFQGISTPVKKFDRITGRKTHQFYYMQIDGKQKMVGSIVFKDIFDVSDRIIKIEKQLNLYSPTGGHIQKIAYDTLNEFTRYELEVKRRKTILDEIIVQALTSPHAFFKQLIDELFEMASSELEVWKRTGKVTGFYDKLHGASDEINTDIQNLFQQTDLEHIDSQYKVLNDLIANDPLIVDANGVQRTDVRLIENLKFFIKSK